LLISLLAWDVEIDVVVLVVSDPGLILVEGNAPAQLRSRPGREQHGLQTDIKDHAPDPDAMSSGRSIESQEVHCHRHEIEPVRAGPPAVVELDRVAELVEW
jgi:hypothetical protein